MRLPRCTHHPPDVDPGKSTSVPHLPHLYDKAIISKSWSGDKRKHDGLWKDLAHPEGG